MAQYERANSNERLLMKAILSPELLEVLQDASNKNKVRHILTTSTERVTEAVDIIVDGKKKRLSLSPVAQPAPKSASQG